MKEKKEINIVNSTKQQYERKKTIIAAIWVVFGSIIYSLSVVWLFSLANLTSSGITGLSQIIVSYTQGITGIEIPLAAPYIIINIPLMIIGYKYVSKRFLYLTILSVTLQFIILLVFESISKNTGFNPFSFFDKETDRFVLTVLAGASAGLGAGICLKFGGSSGGTDIIANALVMRRNKSFTVYSFIMDAIIVVACGISFNGGFHFDMETSIYTLIRLFFYLVAINAVYDIYSLIDIRIITAHPEEMRDMLLSKIFHGFTMYEAKGGFTREPKVVFEIIASTFELQDYIDIAKHIDGSHAFVLATKVKGVHGNIVKKTIV